MDKDGKYAFSISSVYGAILREELSHERKSFI